jgi:hypothetical protein
LRTGRIDLAADPYPKLNLPAQSCEDNNARTFDLPACTHAIGSTDFRACSPLERRRSGLEQIALDEGEKDAGRNRGEHARGNHLLSVDQELGDDGRQADGDQKI